VTAGTHWHTLARAHLGNRRRVTLQHMDRASCTAAAASARGEHHLRHPVTQHVHRADAPPPPPPPGK
jgi:hypothetical protein